jgi:hypothetical protein
MIRRIEESNKIKEKERWTSKKRISRISNNNRTDKKRI